MQERAFLPNLESITLAYNTQLDINEYKQISGLEGTIPQHEFAQIFLNWQTEKLINLETNIGERFNAILFEVKYPFKNGRMLHPFKNENALDTVIKGQQYRLGSTINLNHDQQRELAEVESFSAIEEFFRENPKNTNRLIIPSPPGGNYQNNFIDIFHTSKNHESIVLQRFAVSTPLTKHINIAQKLTQNQIGNINSTSADTFIKSIVISTPKSVEEILSFYLSDKNTLSLKEYEKLKTAYKPWATKYIEAVANEQDKQEIDRILLSSYKFADIYIGEDTDETATIIPQQIYQSQQIPHLVHILAPQPVRTVLTGCGIQGGTNNRGLIYESLFGSFESSLTSKNEDQYGTLKIHCEECNRTYNRTSGKLEEKCRYCGGTKGIIC